MILSEMIERIRFEAANLSNGPLDYRIANSEALIEIILPRVFAIITQNAVKNPDYLNALRRDHSITFTNGVGTLPETIKEEYANSIYFKEFPEVSYQPTYTDFYSSTRPPLVGIFHLGSNSVLDTTSGRNIFFIPPVTLTGTTLTFNSLTIASNEITIATHGLYDGQAIAMSFNPGIITGLTDGQTVYVIKTGTNTFKVATTRNNALSRVNALISNGGAGTIDVNYVGQFTGTLTINAVTIPTLPATMSTAVALKDTLLEETITLAANIVAGKIKIPGLDYPELTDG